MNLQSTEYENQKDFVRTWMRGSIPIRLSVFWFADPNKKVRLLEFPDRDRLESINRHAFHRKRKCIFFNCRTNRGLLVLPCIFFWERLESGIEGQIEKLENLTGNQNTRCDF